jgi:hypothetical protein
MNDHFAIGRASLGPETRRRVERDARLLMVWWLAVGLAATVLLHRLGGVRSPRGVALLVLAAAAATALMLLRPGAETIADVFR